MTNEAMGRRVRQARESAGLSQADLAAFLDLDNTMVSKIEAGSRRLQMHELFGVVEATGFPLSHFRGEVEPTPELALSARLKEGRLSVEDDPAIARVDALVRAHRDLARTGVQVSETPEIPLKVSGPPWNQGVAGARQLRSKLEAGTGPMSDLADRIETHLGFHVALQPEQSPISGLCATIPGFTLLFVNTDNDPGHQNFTLAHELAHAIFGDGGLLQIHLEGDDQGKGAAETRADAFAVEFLLPAQGVRRWFERLTPVSDHDILDGMLAFGVSLPAMVNRLQNLNLIGADQASRLRDEHTRKTLFNSLGRGEEYLAAEAQRKHVHIPRVLRHLASEAFKSGQAGVGPLAAIEGRDPLEVFDRERVSSAQPGS